MKFQFLKKLFFCMVVSLSINMQASRSRNLSSFLPKSLTKYNSKPLIAVPKVNIQADPSSQTLNDFVKQENEKQQKQKFYDSTSNSRMSSAILGLGVVGLLYNVAEVEQEERERQKKRERQKEIEKQKELERKKERERQEEIEKQKELERKKERERQEEIERQEAREKYLKNTVDVKDVDPELYAVFLKIKKNLGIDEDILFVIDLDDNFKAGGQFWSYLNIIKINKNYKKYYKAGIVYILAHELEHYRQSNKYAGSYDRYSQNKPYSEVSLKLETGADAGAGGYFDCPECLKQVAEIGATDYNVDPNLSSGYFRTKRGYFAPEDYESYVDRACQEGELCHAHKILSEMEYPEVFDFDFMNFKKKEFPLSYYLPKSAQ